MNKTLIDMATVISAFVVLLWIAGDALAAEQADCGGKTQIDPVTHLVQCSREICQADEDHPARCRSITHSSTGTVTLYSYDPVAQKLTKTTNVLQSGANITNCRCVEIGTNTILSQGDCCRAVRANIAQGVTALGTNGSCGGTLCPTGVCTGSLNALIKFVAGCVTPE